MYHTMYPPSMMVQILGGQQSNGMGPSPQHSNSTNANNATRNSHQNEHATSYIPDVHGNGRNCFMQTGSYPLELFRPMGVDVPGLRRQAYSMQSNGASPGNWQRRGCSSNNPLTMPPPHLNNRTNTAGSLRKQNWNNKPGKRNGYREQLPLKEIYSSDSGFSSRSTTPNKHPADNSHTESSDDRDSVSSSADQGNKRLQELHANSAIGNERPAEVGKQTVGTTQQFHQNRVINPYHNAADTSRTQMQNYQSKKRYHTGRSSPPSQRTQKGRRYSGVLVPNYSMLPYIAPDRFLARSHLVQVNVTPSDLYGAAMWDDLSREIWSKFMANQQTESTYRNKMVLWKYLHIYIKSTFPKYGLFLVGSTMNGFGSDNSDVDLCLLVRQSEMIQRTEAIGHLQQIQKCLRSCEFVDQLELIKAKVPILKFRDYFRNLEIDLNCNNSVGMRNTHLLSCYSRIDWRVRPLVLVVKLWAQCQDINDAKNMTISSYSLVLMVINFLQCGVQPSILPCLQSIYPIKFSNNADIQMIDFHEELRLEPRPPNRQSLGELLYEFLKYYATFDYTKYAISVRLARKVLIDECRRAVTYKNDPYEWKYLCVEEPFELTNTARSVYDYAEFSRIKQVFAHSHQRLKANRDLSSIFMKTVPRVNPGLYGH